MMLIPLWVAVYTFNFGRWMHKRGNVAGTWGAYLFVALELGVSGWVFLRNGS
ncbi:hypothetical protein [Tumebacillus permanentifrigoris]|uniref:Uncharacterized protein n=1 Tax=Tumebacillus permanentifrigoris TaxID=378543 RepID=A0A316D8E6_9BACL|nr:hypothetical protein [Tumebacillus permanentifrigoris]PWK12847.1 hypothetical protein C7459_109209 [Tumebacillus permanentifrigoris]